VAPGGISTGSAAAARADPRPIAPVAAVKANFLNMPLLPVMKFKTVSPALSHQTDQHRGRSRQLNLFERDQRTTLKVIS
jgi:hypothetical protein